MNPQEANTAAQIRTLTYRNQLREGALLARAYLQDNRVSPVVTIAYGELLLKWMGRFKIENDRKKILKIVDELARLTFAPEFKQFPEEIGWNLFRLLKYLVVQDPVPYQAINRIFILIQKLPYGRPSLLHSLLAGQLLKIAKQWDWSGVFVEWFDWQFREEDTQPYVLEGQGKRGNDLELMPLTEKMLYAASRSLMQQVKISEEDLSALEHHYQQITNGNYNKGFTGFYLGQLYLQAGNKEKALEAYLPWMRDNQSQFWAWQYLAEMVSPELKTACMASALTCPGKNGMKKKVYQYFFKHFQQQGKLEEAGSMADLINRVCEQDGWPVPVYIQDFLLTAGEITAKPLDFRSLAAPARELLLDESKSDLAILTGYHKESKKLFYQVDDQKHGMFYSGLFQQPFHEGKVVKIYWNDDRSKVVACKEYKDEMPVHLVKEFEGKIKIRPGNPFGFVENVFIAPGFVSKHQLKDGDIVQGKGIKAYNRNQKKSSWRVVRLVKSESTLYGSQSA